jgi:hypothetical protein
VLSGARRAGGGSGAPKRQRRRIQTADHSGRLSRQLGACAGWRGAVGGAGRAREPAMRRHRGLRTGGGERSRAHSHNRQSSWRVNVCARRELSYLETWRSDDGCVIEPDARERGGGGRAVGVQSVLSRARGGLSRRRRQPGRRRKIARSRPRDHKEHDCSLHRSKKAKYSRPFASTPCFPPRFCSERQ